MLFDVSFQLSFGVVLSLIILIPHIERILPPLPRWVTLPLAGSIAAEIGIAPIIAYYFYRVSLITTFANLPVIPLAEISINLGALTLLSSPLSSLSGIFASANWLVLEIMIKTVKFFSNLSLAMTLYLYLSLIALMIISKAEFWKGRNIFKYTILLLMIASGILIYQSSSNDAPSVAMDMKPPSLLSMILYYLTLGMIINIERLHLARFKGKLVILLLLGINIFVWSKALSPPNRTLEVAFLDVGQGDSMFLHFPDGKNVLIDGGGSGREDFDVGERILLPYLRYRGVKRIDVMILTHHNTDHMEGLIAVLNKLKVGLVIDNGKMNDDFSKLVEGKEIEYKVVREGQALDFGEGIIAYVLNPGKEMLSNSVSNNNSVVLKLIYGDMEFLFTGDIERETEERMSLYGKSLDSDILKVAHHGASNSSIPAFLKFVHPESAVISVGRNNFGHPDPEVIARLEGLATEVYRTDERGTITIKTEGEGYKVFTMKEAEPNLALVDI